MRIPTLNEAGAVAARADLPIADRVMAADVLVAHGDLDGAERAIADLAADAEANTHLSTLMLAIDELRRLDVPGRLARDPEMVAQLGGSFEMIVAGNDRAARTIVVCTDITERFWLCLPILQLFLEPFEARVIYLRDARNQMFVNGIQGFGESYAATAAGLGGIVGRDRDRLSILACSGGGYFGLRLGVDLKAASFLGFSVRTDLSLTSPLPVRGPAALLKRQTRAEALIDLRPMLTGSRHPATIDLYLGAENRVDHAHASHLDGIERVRAHRLDTPSHNSVQQLLAERRFAAVIAEHLDGVRPGPPAWRPPFALR